MRSVTAQPAGPTRRAAALVPVGLLAGLLATGCTAATPGSSGLPPIGATTTAPPAPPAACLLDTDALTASTHLTWTADATTASDTRCVYDPALPAGAAPTAPDHPEFLAVDLAAATGKTADAQLDVLAQPCAAGSRKPTKLDGFVCRFPAGSVFAGGVRADRLITIAASGVPEGTTADVLSTALGQQLDALG